MRVAGPDEVSKKRVRIERLGAELWMKLDGDKPRMFGQLDRLDELAIRGPSGEEQAMFGQF